MKCCLGRAQAHEGHQVDSSAMMFSSLYGYYACSGCRADWFTEAPFSMQDCDTLHSTLVHPAFVIHPIHAVCKGIRIGLENACIDRTML